MAYVMAGAACMTSVLMLSTPASLVSAFLHSPIVSSRGSATELTATDLRPIGVAGPWSDVSADEQPASTRMCSDTTRNSVCDQCEGSEVGDRCELDVIGSERGRGTLAVCNPPGCGLTFAQCPRCERDYGGCCSTACRALYLAPSKQRHDGTERGHVAIIDGTVENGQLRRPRMATMPADSPKLEGPALLGFGVEEATTSDDMDGMRQGAGGGGDLSEGRTTGIASEVITGLSKSDINTGNRRQKNRDFSVPKTTLATSALEYTDGPAAGAEAYASRHSAPESLCLAHVREATDRTQAGGVHMVSGHLQGELLKLLTRLCRAKRVLDVGTFTGYSALAFAEALPEDGEVVTLESDARAAETANGHFKASPHGEKIELLCGQAMDSIEKLIEGRTPPFDVIFIDADKKRYWDYYEKALAGPWPLLAPAGILLADNVLFHDLVPLAEALRVGNTPEAMNGFKGSSDSVSQGPEKRLKRHGENSEGRENVSGVSRPQRTGGVSTNVTPRRLKIAKSLDGFNKRVADDDRVDVLMLPLRDGLSVVRWKEGRYPHPSQ